jgi:hypothetical protein
MARCFDDEINELTLYDNISNSNIVMYYRDPTTEERTAYANESVQRKRNKIVMRVPETRIKFGALIMTGFREGDIIVKEAGQKIAISSDPGSPNYRSDWKDRWKLKAADLLMLLAAHVFDVSAETEDPELDADEAG